MQHVQIKIVSIADACLGGLRGRRALLIGPEDACRPYQALLQQAGMHAVFQERDYTKVPILLPQVQLLMNVSAPYHPEPLLLTAALIAEGCVGRRTPLVIFDLAASTSVEELAGLLPAVCLYTPSDLRHALYPNTESRIA